MTGLAELISGDTALSGVVGAVGLGALVGVGGELTTRTVTDPDRGRPPPTPPTLSPSFPTNQ